jgi:uncharacterized membrane protein
MNYLSSSSLLVGYSEYIAMLYFLHAVLTLKGEKREAISISVHALLAVKV